VSKIYDALRKAERERGKPLERSAAAARPGPSVHIEDDALILAGMNENFRRSLLNLKSAIDSEMKERNSRVILFTSAVQGEGKTTVVASLARVLSLGESRKILLVDCSVRNPALGRLFGVKGEKGIADFLEGRAKLDEIIQPITEGVLDIVTAGASQSLDMAQPLFDSERYDFFISEVSKVYHYVLIDSSAVLEAPETPLLGARSDGIVMVVYAGKTKREVIRRAMVMIQKLDGKFIGTVLNRKQYHIPEFLYRRV
jgi:capsular exopolysaccharide synthesis family protein